MAELIPNQSLFSSAGLVPQPRTLTMSQIAMIVHDLRGPLAGIQGLNELLTDEVSPHRKERMHRQIDGTVAYLLRLAEDILTLASAESGRLPIDEGIADVREIIESTCNLMCHSSTLRNITFRSEIDPSIPNQLRGDPIRLRQIVDNLMTNALKFSPDGGEIVIKAGTDADGRFLRICVHDQGPGLTGVEIAQIFEPFSQGNVARERRKGGVGLGLSISRAFAEGMGGRIEVQSELGKGSCFSLIFPHNAL